MASLIILGAATLMEFDEVSVKRSGNKITYEILTSGLSLATAQVKSKIWGMASPPLKRLKITNVEELERGAILKRYKITAVGELKSAPAPARFVRNLLNPPKKAKRKRKKTKRKK